MKIEFLKNFARDALCLVVSLFSKLVTIVYDSGFKSSKFEKVELVKELREALEGLAVQETTTPPPSEKFWRENINSIRELILEGHHGDFLRWPIFSNMFVGNEYYIITEFVHLLRRRDWHRRWKEAIRECIAGNPPPFFLYPSSSGNLIHHAYHLSQFEEQAGIKIDTLEYVFEFGGGYGSMCRLFYNLGFRGKYLIYDYPALSALQKYFLCSLDIPVYTTTSFASADTGVVCVSDIEELRPILKNNFRTTNSLFIAMWSISETEETLRNFIHSLIPGFSSYFVAYQDQFAEMDNIDYFEKVKRDYGRLFQWKERKIRHLRGNNYLIGRRFRDISMGI